METMENSLVYTGSIACHTASAGGLFIRRHASLIRLARLTYSLHLIVSLRQTKLESHISQRRIHERLVPVLAGNGPGVCCSHHCLTQRFPELFCFLVEVFR